MHKIFLEIQSQILSRYKDDPNVLGVMVFGSQVSGQADAFSDIDLYVLTDKVGLYTRQSFLVSKTPVDVIIDSVDMAREYLQDDRYSIRRPTSIMLAGGKIIFERTDDLNKLQKTAKRNLRLKTRSTKSDFLMHAYSLDDFLKDLQRDVKNNNRLQFALNEQLFVNNAIELVLRKHGSYWRHINETLAELNKLDHIFIRYLSKLFFDDSLEQRLKTAQKVFVYLKKRYKCSLPKKWTINY